MGRRKRGFRVPPAMPSFRAWMGQRRKELLQWTLFTAVLGGLVAGVICWQAGQYVPSKQVELARETIVVEAWQAPGYRRGHIITARDGRRFDWSLGYGRRDEGLHLQAGDQVTLAYDKHENDKSLGVRYLEHEGRVYLTEEDAARIFDSNNRGLWWFGAAAALLGLIAMPGAFAAEYAWKHRQWKKQMRRVGMRV